MCSLNGNKCLIILFENSFPNILVYYMEGTLDVESSQMLKLAQPLKALPRATRDIIHLLLHGIPLNNTK